jgi:hypothetical protein
MIGEVHVDHVYERFLLVADLASWEIFLTSRMALISVLLQ